MFCPLRVTVMSVFLDYLLFLWFDVMPCWQDNLEPQIQPHQYRSWGLYYKTIMIVIMTIISDATIWSITYVRNWQWLRLKAKVKHIYSTVIIYDCNLQSSKYFYNSGHWYTNCNSISDSAFNTYCYDNLFNFNWHFNNFRAMLLACRVAAAVTTKPVAMVAGPSLWPPMSGLQDHLGWL